MTKGEGGKNANKLWASYVNGLLSEYYCCMPLSDFMTKNEIRSGGNDITGLQNGAVMFRVF